MEIDSPNATGVVSGFGVPTAGTSGQLLQKVNATNYNTQWVNLDTPTYIQASVGGGQVFTSGATTTVTGWSNVFTQNAGEWNPSTGLLTATKVGWYAVSATVTFASTTDTANTEYAVGILKNGSVISNARVFVPIAQTTTATFKHPGPATAIVQLAIGDTLSIYAGQFAGANRTLHTNGNYVSIQELPGKILK